MSRLISTDGAFPLDAEGSALEIRVHEVKILTSLARKDTGHRTFGVFVTRTFVQGRGARGDLVRWWMRGWCWVSQQHAKARLL
jgi:hypothetical protein